MEKEKDETIGGILPIILQIFFIYFFLMMVLISVRFMNNLYFGLQQGEIIVSNEFILLTIIKIFMVTIMFVLLTKHKVSPFYESTNKNMLESIENYFKKEKHNFKDGIFLTLFVLFILIVIISFILYIYFT